MEKTSENKNQKFKEFLNFINGLELKSIWLDNANFELSNFPSNKGNNTFFHDHEYELEDRTNDLFLVKSVSHVKAQDADENDLFKMVFAYHLLYKSKLEFKKEFFDRFTIGVLPSHSYPYEREFIQNMVSRMNLPPLTLPMWKSPGLQNTGLPNESKSTKEKKQKPAKKDVVKINVKTGLGHPFFKHDSEYPARISLFLAALL